MNSLFLANSSNVILAQDETAVTTQHWFARQFEIPWWALIGLTLLLAAFVLLIYRQERGSSSWLPRTILIVLRVVVLGSLVFLLPVWMQSGAQTELPELIIAVDASRSMDHIDLERTNQGSVRLGDTSRLEMVRQHLQKHRRELDDLKKQYRLRYFVVSDQAISVENESQLWERETFDRLDRNATRLGESLSSIVDRQRGIPTAAIVWFSDGVNTDGIPLSQAAVSNRRLQPPLYLVGVGTDRPSSDFELSDLRAEESVFVDDLVTFRVAFRAQGMQGETANIKLTREGDPEVIERQSVTIESDEDVTTLSFSHRPENEGGFNYVIEVESNEKEVNKENNTVAVRVSVRDETMRVLLVAFQPSYEFRTLKQMLEREINRSAELEKATVSLSVLLQDAQLKYSQNDRFAIPVFPIRQEALFEYDVVILCDAAVQSPVSANRGLGRLEQELLYDFVAERGGSLVLISGPNNLPASLAQTRLEALLPANPNDLYLPPTNTPLIDQQKISLTDFGAEHPVFRLRDSLEDSLPAVSNLEGVCWRVRVDSTKAGVMTLANFDSPQTTEEVSSRPAITLQRIGGGMVWTHLFDESYRWNVQATKDDYERFWLQALRFLSRGKLASHSQWGELKTNRRVYEYDERVQVQLRFLDPTAAVQSEAVDVDLLSSDQAVRSVQLIRDLTDPLLYRTTISGLAPGQYEFRYGQIDRSEPIDTPFSVNSQPGEFEQLQVDRVDLATAAKVTQGKFMMLDDAEKLWEKLPAGKQLNVSPIPPKSIWELPWLTFAIGSLLFGSLAAEWLLRRRLGMV